MLAIVFWIVVAITVVVLDATTGSFLFCWFAVGALGAIVSSFLGVTFGVQIIIFLILSIVTIAIGYPWAKKNFKKTIEYTPLMEEKYIGKVLIAEDEIKGKSKIKLEGIYWTVDSKFEIVKKGEKFRITSIEGNKLIIKREEE